MFRHSRHTSKTQSGQAMIFSIMALVILLFVVMWNFDVHKTLFVKSISQDGGDSAALVAARWQAVSLNVIGDLNIMKAIALSAGDSATVDAVANLQSRISFVGPMIGFMASQQAAKNNGIYQNDDFTTLVREHAHRVRFDYTSPVGPGGSMLFPEPYPGAWTEYADMLDLVADDGVAAGPENIRLFSDYEAGHILLNVEFYDAVAGRNWCWFFHNAPTLLSSYTGYTWWPALPPFAMREYINSEIYGLSLTRIETSAESMVDADALLAMAADRGIVGRLTPEGMATSVVWYCYGGEWGTWDAMDVLSADPFPSVGPVKEKYNYAGADAATRVEARMTRMTPGQSGNTVSNTILWTAAAKAFGYLDDTTPPHVHGMVLPAFHDVRLIPLDASSAPSGGGFDIAWRRHVEIHLPDYMDRGPPSYACHYCAQLRQWEVPAFRASGVAWLAANSARCIPPPGGPGGGGGGGGGRRRGH